MLAVWVMGLTVLIMGLTVLAIGLTVLDIGLTVLVIGRVDRFDYLIVCFDKLEINWDTQQKRD